VSAFEIHPIGDSDRSRVKEIIRIHWGGPKIVSRGKVHLADSLPGFVAADSDKLIGLVTYYIQDRECEIVSLNSLIEGIGVGLALINAVKTHAILSYCHRLWLITTNDNIKAIGFYQKRGFRFKAVSPDAVAYSRTIKPEIPMIGLNGIPLRDEIEFELIL
jgi:GNAT superfamily N-acetyltransferase